MLYIKESFKKRYMHLGLHEDHLMYLQAWTWINNEAEELCKNSQWL